jgi:hypothetical protein
MAHHRREAVGVAEGVEHHRGDEQRRGDAAQAHGAQRVAVQADEGAAGEELVAAEAAGLAGVGAEEALQREDRRQAAAQVFLAAQHPVARGHRAVFDGVLGVRAGRVDARGRQIDQALELHAALGLRGTGTSQQGSQGEAADGSGLLHEFPRGLLWSRVVVDGPVRGTGALNADCVPRCVQ